MSTEPKPESPAELAADAKRLAKELNAYGAAFPDGKGIFGESAAPLRKLAAIATIQASKPVAKIVNGNLAWNLAQPTDAVPVELLRGEHLLYTAATQARPASGEADRQWDIVREVLREFRLHDWVDDDGEMLPLTDLLCHKGDTSIERGSNTLNMLCDDIVAALAAPTSTPSENNHGED